MPLDMPEEKNSIIYFVLQTQKLHFLQNQPISKEANVSTPMLSTDYIYSVAKSHVPKCMQKQLLFFWF
mgnify:CR=1